MAESYSFEHAGAGEAGDATPSDDRTSGSGGSAPSAFSSVHYAAALFFPFIIGVLIAQDAPRELTAATGALAMAFLALTLFMEWAGLWLLFAFASALTFGWFTGGVTSPLLPWVVALGALMLAGAQGGGKGVLATAFLVMGILALWLAPAPGARALPETIAQFLTPARLAALDIFHDARGDRRSWHSGLSLLFALVTFAFAGAPFRRHSPPPPRGTALGEESTYAAARLVALSLDGRGIIEDCQGAWERVTGITPAMARGMGFRDFLHPDDLPLFEAMRHDKTNGGNLRRVLRLRNRLGGFVSLEAMRVAHDPPTGALRLLVREIWRTRGAFTAAPPEDAGNPQRTAFLTGISHDLRTPLNAIIGFSDIMRAQLFGPIGQERYRDYARLIYESGQRLLDMIDDLLDLSTIEGGRLELENERFDVGPLLEGCARIARERFDTQGVGALFRLPVAPISIRSDRRAFRRLVNLLLSCAAWRAASGSTVTLSLVRQGRSAGRQGDWYLEIALLPPAGTPVQKAQQTLKSGRELSGETDSEEARNRLDRLVARSLALMLSIELTLFTRARRRVCRLKLPEAREISRRETLLLEGASGESSSGAADDRGRKQTGVRAEEDKASFSQVGFETHRPDVIRAKLKRLEAEIARVPSRASPATQKQAKPAAIREAAEGE